MPLDRVDLNRLAALTDTLSGADIAALCKQAAVTAMTRIASRADQSAGPQVRMTDFEAALTTLQQSHQRLHAQQQDASMARFLDALSGVRNIPQTTEG
jgi:SpoVK/Ycf46/Vps4 family AAA+-type ATPase